MLRVTLALAALVFALGLPSRAAAQWNEDPVTVTFSVDPERARPGARVEVLATARIAAGWHIFGAKETQGVPSKLVVTPGPGASLEGPPRAPAAIREEVPFLGTMAILRGEVTFRQQITIPDDASGRVSLPAALTFQACSEGEGGVCLAPETVEGTVAVTVAVEPSGVGGREGAEDREAGVGPSPDTPWNFAGVADEPGEPAVAIEASVSPERARPGDWVEVRVTVTIAETWHIGGVQDPAGLPTRLDLDLPTELLVGGALLEAPAARPFADPNLGEMLIHEDQATFRQKVQVLPGAAAGSLELRGALEWQACDPSVCVPGSSPFELRLAVDPAAPASGIEPPPVETRTSPGGADPATGARPGELGLLGLFLASIGFGLAMLVMPCTYPMIPITISLFSKGESLSRGRSVWRAAAYAGGIVLSFVLVGGVVQVVFASAGQDALNSLATNAWINLLIGGIFVYFAFSFFGYYELGLPAPLRRLMQLGQGRRDQDGTVPTWSLFLMGLFFVLTAYTCGAPVVFSLFATAAGEASPFAILGSTLVFALTVALPFFGLALIPSGMRLLPKSGSWFTVFKVVLGFVELGFAVKFFRGTDLQWAFVNLLPRSTTLALWTLLALGAATYLHGYFPVRFPHQPDLRQWSPRRYAWGWGFVLLAGYFGYGALGYDLNSRVEALILPDSEIGEDGETITFGLPYHTDLAHLEAAKAQARETGSPVLLMFTGHYCPNCVQMEKGVLPDERVMARLERAAGRVALFIDKADDPGELAHRELMLERYNPSSAIPAFFVIDGQGEVRSQQIGNCSVESFLGFLAEGGL